MSISRTVAETVDKAEAGTFLHSRALVGAQSAIDTAWSREASRRPDLIRVHRGLYWKGSLTRFGVTKPSRMQLAQELSGEGAGPAGWSALSVLGLTTQMPQTVEFAAVGGRPKVDGVHVSLRSNKERRALSALEIAVLEVLRPEWASKADRDPIQRVKELAAEGKIRLKVMAQAAKLERPAVREPIRELALLAA